MTPRLRICAVRLRILFVILGTNRCGQMSVDPSLNADSERVMELLWQKCLKASEIAFLLKITPGAARRILLALRDEGQAFQNELGYWEPSPIASLEAP